MSGVALPIKNMGRSLGKQKETDVRGAAVEVERDKSI